MLNTELLKQRGLISTGYHLPYNPKLKERARELRKNMTEAEKQLWHGLLRRFTFPVLRQKPIDNYIVDFYCPKYKLVIEVNGDSHDTNDGQAYDEVRTAILEGYGLSILRVMNEEVLSDFENVKKKILEKMNPP